MMKALTNPQYFSEIMRLTKRVRGSIIVVNYLFELSGAKKDPVLLFAKAILGAHRRGVKVSAILEGSRFDKNYPLYRMLKDKGVDVWLDTSKTFIHQKAILIDGKTLVAGSHNLTAASLLHSEELSFSTDDHSAIDVFNLALKNITKQREEIRSALPAKKIRLPAGIIGSVIAPLFRACAKNAFTLYMMFCFEDGGKPRPIAIDAKRWCLALGFKPSDAQKGRTKEYLKYYYMHRLNRILGQLKRLNLVELDRDKDTIKRRSIYSSSKSRAESRDESRSKYIEVPETFWHNGWPARLSFPAKYFYFISLAETLDSPFYPWWSLSVRRIVKKYRCDASILKGALELEKYGILEILRGIPKKRGKYYSEEAQFYRTNPLKKPPPRWITRTRNGRANHRSLITNH